MRPAVFLDRDGTLIELVHHLSLPSEVRLLPSAGPAVRSLRDRGYACVVVSNQSAIGRGKLTEAGLGEVHAELVRQLFEVGAELDGFYFSPLKPTVEDPTVIEHPDRKPGPGMLRRAASELGLDLGSSWMVGDAVSDILAGKNAGCKATILVRTGYGSRLAAEHAGHVEHVVDDVGSAARLILELDGGGRGPRSLHGEKT
jgi:D-glycero-D-manno-heptose 1,7-bisphosphate phosphatase